MQVLKMDPQIDCLIFHDVDLLPENERNIYACDSNYPRHLSVSIDKFLYNLPYNYLVGGVLAIKPEHYKRANGILCRIFCSIFYLKAFKGVSKIKKGFSNL